MLNHWDQLEHLVQTLLLLLAGLHENGVGLSSTNLANPKAENVKSKPKVKDILRDPIIESKPGNNSNKA